MPSLSTSQQEMFAIAEHDPDKLYARNRGVLKSMNLKQLADFASTPHKGLPKHVKKRKKAKARR